MYIQNGCSATCTVYHFWVYVIECPRYYWANADDDADEDDDDDDDDDDVAAV